MADTEMPSSGETLTHDLRNQLNSISLVLQVIQRRLSKHAELHQDLEELEMLRKRVHETVKKLDKKLDVTAA